MRIKDITIESREPVRVCNRPDCQLANLRHMQGAWVCSRGHVQPPTPAGEDIELVVTLRYSAHKLEAAHVGSLLAPGSSTPPHEFWQALDWGYVEGDRDDFLQQTVEIIKEEERVAWLTSQQE